MSHNKAFCTISELSLGNGHIAATGVLLDANDVIIGQVAGSSIVEHSDSSSTIHQKLADSIRDTSEDQSIVVVFLDSPGRF